MFLPDASTAVGVSQSRVVLFALVFSHTIRYFASMPSNSDWPAEVTQAIASAVRQRRNAHGMSAQQLADICAQLGMPSLTRPVLADLENGRRTWISVAELLVLARALNTIPLALLYPDPCAAEIEMLPGVRATAALALQWFSGLLRRPERSELAEDTVAYSHDQRRLEIAREIWGMRCRIAALPYPSETAPLEERRAWAFASTDYHMQTDELLREYAALTLEVEIGRSS
jgi:transcriptional regulator with XRE-family HTH domain